MNSCMGDGNDKDWYGNAHTIYKKISDLKKLRPVNAWVFVDEHPDSINDGCFFVNVTAPEWIDLPASYHNGAAGFAFADGHSEIKKWLDPRTKAPVQYQNYNNILVPGSRDYAWVKDHTSEPRF